MIKKLICIVCPNGCSLSIDDNLNVSGNKCLRGVEYAKNEVTNPLRSLTSTVKLTNSRLLKVLPVRTSGLIPKDKIFEVMKEIDKISVSTPIKIGDIIISNVLGLNVDIIASRGIDE